MDDFVAEIRHGFWSRKDDRIFVTTYYSLTPEKKARLMAYCVSRLEEIKREAAAKKYAEQAAWDEYSRKQEAMQ